MLPILLSVIAFLGTAQALELKAPIKVEIISNYMLKTPGYYWEDITAYDATEDKTKLTQTSNIEGTLGFLDFTQTNDQRTFRYASSTAEDADIKKVSTRHFGPRSIANVFCSAKCHCPAIRI